ncbi:MAG: hypothetical protein ACREP4_15005 [Stenotrophomonas sp.]|uniref:hypothetical protein n=1 Tax=Stenotrophomonas sp. TaxID=69392 RepID=UPI003D6D8085
MESCAKAVSRFSVPLARRVLPSLMGALLLGCSGAAQQGPADAAADHVSLEEALQGFSNCRLHGFYREGDPLEPVNPYFRQRGLLIPCEVDDAAEIAYFCVKDSFHGLPVDRIEMPSSTATFAQGLHFTVPLEQARAVLLRTLGSDFARSAASDEGNAPELMEIPEDPQRSALLCIQPFG